MNAMLKSKTMSSIWFVAFIFAASNYAIAAPTAKEESSPVFPFKLVKDEVPTDPVVEIDFASPEFVPGRVAYLTKALYQSKWGPAYKKVLVVRHNISSSQSEVSAYSLLLTNGGWIDFRSCVFSPNGRYILLTYGFFADKGDYHLPFLFDTRTETISATTNHSLDRNGQVRWSPYGNELMFVTGGIQMGHEDGYYIPHELFSWNLISKKTSLVSSEPESREDVEKLEKTHPQPTAPSFIHIKPAEAKHGGLAWRWDWSWHKDALK